MLCLACSQSIDAQSQSCPRCGARQPYAETVARVKVRGYAWGRLHGVLLIMSGTAQLIARPDWWPLLACVLALGICILRRNRLIIPLLGFIALVHLFWVLSRLQNQAQIYWRVPVLVLFWAACLVYYLKRKDEFVPI